MDLFPFQSVILTEKLLQLLLLQRQYCYFILMELLLFLINSKTTFYLSKYTLIHNI